MPLKEAVKLEYWVELLGLKSELRYRKYSDTTIKEYTRYVEEFMKFTNKKPDRLTEKDLKRYIDFFRDRIAVNSLAVKQNAVIFFYEKVLGIKVELPTIKKKSKPKNYMTKEEVKCLFDCSSLRNKRMWEKMYYEGYKNWKIKVLFNLSLRGIQYLFQMDLSKAGIRTDKGYTPSTLSYSRVLHLMQEGKIEEAMEAFGTKGIHRIKVYFKGHLEREA